MSKALVTKEDVAWARDQLKAAGKKVTPGALRSALGDRGSLSTISQFKKELDEDERNSKDDSEALEAFRALWSKAEQAGRSQRDEEVRDLQETIAELEVEAPKLEGEVLAAQARAEELGRKLDESAERYNGLNDELTRARDVAERNASKLVAAMEDHKTCQANLQEQMAALKEKNHELELELAKVVTKLEVSTKPLSTPATRVSRRSRLKAPNGNSHQ